MQVIPDCKRKTLEDFITDTCEPGSIIYTDGLKKYKGLPKLGYTHHATAVSQTNDPAHVALPAVHRVASLFKRWLLGTHQGGVAEQHLDAYLDEFVLPLQPPQVAAARTALLPADVPRGRIWCCI